MRRWQAIRSTGDDEIVDAGFGGLHQGFDMLEFADRLMSLRNGVKRLDELMGTPIRGDTDPSEQAGGDAERYADFFRA